MTAALLEVRGLRARYGPTQVLHGIDFGVAEGGITTVLGANGAGKTTLLRAVCNMVASEGEVVLGGTRIDGRPTESIVRMGVGHVPDGRGTFMQLSVEENLRVGAHTRHDRAEVAADFERIYAHFPRLKERRRQQAGTLSGGEQQMLVIGRALMCRPRLLLLDEPTLGLAPIVAGRILESVAQLAANGLAVLLVEQNARAALKLAQRAYVLENGRVVLEGPNLLGDPRVHEAYLGELEMPADGGR
jgi:branched-chain amino acid transport system ATP-binding protein